MSVVELSARPIARTVLAGLDVPDRCPNCKSSTMQNGAFFDLAEKFGAWWKRLCCSTCGATLAERRL